MDVSDVNAQNRDTLWTPLHAATFQEHGKVCITLCIVLCYTCHLSSIVISREL